MDAKAEHCFRHALEGSERMENELAAIDHARQACATIATLLT